MMDWLIAVALLALWARLGNELGGWLRDYDDRRRTARRCARGEHRETVRSHRSLSGLGWIGFVCLDCGVTRPWCSGWTLWTPPRRQKQDHGRAA